jgi:mRNA interferase MazF
LAGLPVPSVIRTAKIATIEAADAAKLGRVSPAVFRQVARRLAGELGLDARQK